GKVESGTNGEDETGCLVDGMSCSFGIGFLAGVVGEKAGAFDAVQRTTKVGRKCSWLNEVQAKCGDQSSVRSRPATINAGAACQQRGMGRVEHRVVGAVAGALMVAVSCQ